MAELIFTQQLTRFISVPAYHCDANNLSEALRLCFAEHPQLGTYILDEQGHLRQHVAIFVDGQRLSDRRDLNLHLNSNSKVYILQALSGG